MKLSGLFLSVALCGLCLAGCRETTAGFRPVNPKATPEAKQLLGFLYSLKGKYVLTGQHNFASDLPRYDRVAY